MLSRKRMKVITMNDNILHDRSCFPIATLFLLIALHILAGCSSERRLLVHVNSEEYLGEGLYVYVYEDFDNELLLHKNEQRIVYIKIINCLGEELLVEDISDPNSLSATVLSNQGQLISFRPVVRSNPRKLLLLESIDKDLFKHSVVRYHENRRFEIAHDLYKCASISTIAVLPENCDLGLIEIDDALLLYDKDSGEFRSVPLVFRFNF